MVAYIGELFTYDLTCCNISLKCFHSLLIEFGWLHFLFNFFLAQF